MIKLSWVDFKNFVTNRTVPIHEELIDGAYHLEAYDGNLARICLLTEAADKTDYETNYQTSANPSLSDSNGITLSRTKITKSGWHFQSHNIEISTSTLLGIYNKDSLGNDLGFTTIKFYDNTDTELVAGTQVELDNNCVKTVIDWEPTYDIDVIGGILKQAAAPSTDVRIWVTAVPDLTVAQGGSVPFVEGGTNLRYEGNKLDLDGKTAKTLFYDNIYHTNKFRIILKHDTGMKHTFVMQYKFYRENK